MLGESLISQAAFDDAFPRAKDRYTFVAGADAGRASRRALADFPDTKVMDRGRVRGR